MYWVCTDEYTGSCWMAYWGKNHQVSHQLRQVAHTGEEDGDFVSSPRGLIQRVQANQACYVPQYELTEEECAQFPSMTTHMTGKPLVDALKDLNVRQRNAAKSIGFQDVLNLKVMETPKKLGN
nr:uncharacterized protein LOC109179738 isoform X2 [Ipomoea batatas]